MSLRENDPAEVPLFKSFMIRFFVFIFVAASTTWGKLGYAQDQSSRLTDSLTVYVIGGLKGEKFKIYFDGKLKLKYKGDRTFYFSFNVPRSIHWADKAQINELVIYRRSRFSFSYRSLSFVLEPYDPKSKFLVLRRSAILVPAVSFEGVWTDEPPKRPPLIHR